MRILLALLVAACTTTSQQTASVHPVDAGDVRCTGAPAAAAGEFRHASSELVVNLGDPRHRGVDLITAASGGTQTLEGWLAYSIADKALEDEDVELFACVDSAWAKLGTARTDGEGHFALALTGPDRLPVGLRDLYASVVGDRTGTAFLADVAADNAALIVSDVDGTLTDSENAFIETVVNGEQPDARDGAAAAFTAAAARGYQLVYVTARGNQYMDATRQWLAARGFPRGPLRLAPSFVTLPGDATVDFKTDAIGKLIAARLSVAMAVGNRASDITAYRNVGLAGTQIAIKLPEYQSEVQSALDTGQAIGFATYAALPQP